MCACRIDQYCYILAYLLPHSQPDKAHCLWFYCLRERMCWPKAEKGKPRLAFEFPKPKPRKKSSEGEKQSFWLPQLRWKRRVGGEIKSASTRGVFLQAWVRWDRCPRRCVGSRARTFPASWQAGDSREATLGLWQSQGAASAPMEGMAGNTVLFTSSVMTCSRDGT